MKKYLLLLLIALCGQTASAQRFPVNDMEIAVLRGVQFPQVQLSNEGFSWLRLLTLGWLDGTQTFDMTAGVRIRDENNRFIVHGRLPEHNGKIIAIRRTPYGQISEIWVLTPAEHEAFRRYADQREALLKQQQ